MSEKIRGGRSDEREGKKKNIKGKLERLKILLNRQSLRVSSRIGAAWANTFNPGVVQSHLIRQAILPAIMIQSASPVLKT